MLHEIFPHTFSNLFQKKNKINSADYVFCFQEDTVLLKRDGTDFDIPLKQDLQYLSEDADFTYLFELNNTPCFIIWDKVDVNDTNLRYQDISFFRTTNKKHVAWSSLVAYHLKLWYSQNKFCGKCGTLTQHKLEERALECPNCKTVYYPNISPAIIVAILSRDKILLARNANFPVAWYSLVAGYSDVGESLEETVVREVKEEVGIDVSNIRYYKSQPWPLSGSMMIGFIADADENQPIVIDEKEITEAAWFTRDNVPLHPPSRSIAGEMIEKFKVGKLN